MSIENLTDNVTSINLQKKLNEVIAPINTSATYPKTYSCAGTICDSVDTSGNDSKMRGIGNATVILLTNHFAQINYAYRITVKSTAYSFYFGLNANTLHALNSNIPVISPIRAGTCLIMRPNTSTPIPIDSNGYGGYNNPANNVINGKSIKYWCPGRIFLNNNTPSWGAWGATDAPINAIDTLVYGTCYGTY